MTGVEQTALAPAATDTLALLERFALPVLLAAIALAGALGGVLLGQWAEERERRRAGYAEAVRVLIAWHEYPYRIRRRVDDEPPTLAALAEIGHALQEQLRYQQTWVSAENASVGRLYRQIAAEVTATCRPACTEAWTCAPASAPADMNLNGWGPPGIDNRVTTLQNAISDRFGWRRAVMAARWRQG